MNFRKFESIENTYIKSNVSKIVFNGLNTGEWIVTEKLHGANFSVYVKDLKVVNFGSRNQFVDGSFYNSADLQEKIRNKIKPTCLRKKRSKKGDSVFDFGSFLNNSHNNRIDEVKAYFKKNKIDIKTADIIFYGELVGDRVQKEVRYTKDIGFFVFDVVVNGKPINKKIAFEFAHLVCLDVTPERKVGTFEECCAIKNSFNSSLSYRIDNDHFGICVADNGFEMYDKTSGKLLEDGLNNEAEGIIIEPVEPMYYNNGKRIYLKNKTPAFSEKNDGVVDLKVKELTEKDNALFNELMLYVNENRLNAIKSKGHPEKAVPFMLTKDILEDYSKENDGIDLRKTAENFKLLTSSLQLEVNKFITGVNNKIT